VMAGAITQGDATSSASATSFTPVSARAPR